MQQMFTKAQAEAFFNTEKTFGLILLIIGILAMVLATVACWGIKTPAYKGAAISLAIFAIFQITVGYQYFSNADALRKNVVYKMDLDPDGLQQKELPRVENALKTLRILQYTAVILAVVGFCFFIYFKQNQAMQLWVGASLLMSVLAIIMLAIESRAYASTYTYLTGLRQFLHLKV